MFKDELLDLSREYNLQSREAHVNWLQANVDMWKDGMRRVAQKGVFCWSFSVDLLSEVAPGFIFSKKLVNELVADWAQKEELSYHSYLGYVSGDFYCDFSW